jgi:hypothetical protein
MSHILPYEYIPGFFASSNNAFHLAFLAWTYDTILSQPGAAKEYMESHLNLLRCIPTYWKFHTQYRLSDTNHVYYLTLQIDKQVGLCQYAMSLLWHNVWLLQYSPSSNKPCNNKSIEMIGSSIAYWFDKMNTHVYNENTFHVMGDELCHHRDMLRQIRNAMHRQDVRRSSPLPTIPSPQERGAESKSMSVVCGAYLI